MSDPIRVVVADDQTVIRESVATMLGLQPDLLVVATAANGAEAVAAALAERADVVLMDLTMPVLDGAGATAELQREAPDVRVLVLTTYGDEASVLRALDAGAAGYLTKDAGREEIARAIRSVASGQAVLDLQLQRRLVHAAVQRGNAASGPVADAELASFGLTARETEVLGLMTGGRSNRDIARQLVVSEGTVKTHINNLFAKLGVGDRAAAMAIGFRSGLGPPA